jgi:hypothetical protein
MIGISLNQYQITAKLGAGGMGEVYRGHDTWLGRDVAVIYYTTKGSYEHVENIRRHLSRFKTILINRKTRSGTGMISIRDYDDFVSGRKYISYVMNASAFKRGDYYCVSYPREQNVFDGPKIVVPQRSPRNTFAYNAIPWYASADVYFILGKSSDYDLNTCWDYSIPCCSIIGFTTKANGKVKFWSSISGHFLRFLSKESSPKSKSRLSLW